MWFCALSDRSFNARTYFSENALLPGLVETEYKNHKLASSLYTEMESFPQRYCTVHILLLLGVLKEN